MVTTTDPAAKAQYRTSALGKYCAAKSWSIELASMSANRAAAELAADLLSDPPHVNAFQYKCGKMYFSKMIHSAALEQPAYIGWS